MENKISTDFAKKYFRVSDVKDKIQLTILDRNGRNCGIHDSFKLEDLLNPKYASFEILKRVLDMYKDNNFEAHLTCSLKDNYLMMLSIIYENVDEETLEMWRKRYFAKFNRI